MIGRKGIVRGWLRRCGKEVWLVEHPNGIHGFYNFAELPESALFVEEVRGFIQKKSKISTKQEIS